MMKKNINYLLIICAVLFFTSCEKNAVQQIDYAPTGAFVRISNFAVGGPSVNFYADGVKITAAGSTTGVEATTGVGAYGIFPGTNSYIHLPNVGNVTISAKTPEKATTNPNITTVSLPTTLVAGKYYSYYTSGIYDATAKTTTAFILEDKLPALDTGFAYVRLVNAIPNATAGYTLAGVHTTTQAAVTIATPTAFMSATDFVKVPNGVYNLTSTSTGSPTIIRNAVSFSKGFVYTIAARGNALTASTQALDLTRNK
jgi:hypothetical protein